MVKGFNINPLRKGGEMRTVSWLKVPLRWKLTKSSREEEQIGLTITKSSLQVEEFRSDNVL